MMRPEVLATLRCPEDRYPLTLAADSLIREINTAIQAGRLRNRAGRKLEQLLDGGLTTTTGHVMYPIIDGIAVLVRDEAIPLAQLGHKLINE